MATFMAQAPLKASFFGARTPAGKAPTAIARSRQTVQVNALFGSKPAASSAGAATQYHICIDCGFIYDGAQEFKALPGSYKCPVCSSPKNRFKVYKGTDVKGKPNNAPATMKKRKESKQW